MTAPDDIAAARLAEARALVVRLKARRAAAVGAWCAANLTEVRDADR